MTTKLKTAAGSTPTEIEALAAELSELWRLFNVYDGTTTALAGKDDKESESLKARLSGMEDACIARTDALRAFIATREPVTARDTVIFAVLASGTFNLLAGCTYHSDREREAVERLVSDFLAGTLRGLKLNLGIEASDVGLESYAGFRNYMTFAQRNTEAMIYKKRLAPGVDSETGSE